jgi:hypothetical protein
VQVHKTKETIDAAKSRDTMGRETDSLLSSSPNDSSKYYFLNRSNTEYQGGTTHAVRDGDGGVVVEGIPEGTTEEEFAPRTLTLPVRIRVPDSLFYKFDIAIYRNVALCNVYGFAVVIDRNLALWLFYP